MQQTLLLGPQNTTWRQIVPSNEHERPLSISVSIFSYVFLRQSMYVSGHLRLLKKIKILWLWAMTEPCLAQERWQAKLALGMCPLFDPGQWSTPQKKRQAHAAVLWPLLLCPQAFLLPGWRRPAGCIHWCLTVLMQGAQDLAVSPQTSCWICYGSISAYDILTDCRVCSFFCHSLISPLSCCASMEESATWYSRGNVFCTNEESEATTSMEQREKRSCEVPF